MGLIARARKLELARGIGRGGAPRPVALVWTVADVVVDRAALGDGDLVVSDYVLIDSGSESARALRRDRVTSDPEEFGRVLDVGGRVIGRVLRGAKGGALLEYAMPAGAGSA